MPHGVTPQQMHTSLMNTWYYYLGLCLSAVVGGMLCKSDKPSIIIIITTWDYLWNDTRNNTWNNNWSYNLSEVRVGRGCSPSIPNRTLSMTDGWDDKG